MARKPMPHQVRTTQAEKDAQEAKEKKMIENFYKKKKPSVTFKDNVPQKYYEDEEHESS